MNDQLNRERLGHSPLNGESAGRGRAASPRFSGRPWRPGRWLAGLLAALLWLALVYGLPLKSLRAARARERAELVHSLQADKPDTASIIAAFDYASEEMVFSATGPYLILAVASVFLTAHLVGVQRRLHAAERAIEEWRDDSLRSGQRS